MTLKVIKDPLEQCCYLYYSLSVSFPWHRFFLSTEEYFGRPVQIRGKELTQLWSEPAHSDPNFP